MAKKTEFVRVAVSGPTVDGRNIDPVMLQQAAKNYNRETYAARGNLEHIRGFSGDKPFGMYADVLALKSEPIKLEVAGKLEDKIGLFAQLEVSDDLVDLNKRGQKLYSSIELLPDFAGSKEAYMVGLAFTDSPASLGTQRLQFSKAFGTTPTDPVELELKLEAPTPAQAASANVGEALRDLFKSWMPATAPAVAPPAPPAPAAAPTDFAAFATGLHGALEKMTGAIEASNKANAEATAKVAADLDALTKRLETTPSQNYSARPPATGGAGQILAEF